MFLRGFCGILLDVSREIFFGVSPENSHIVSLGNSVRDILGVLLGSSHFVSLPGGWFDSRSLAGKACALTITTGPSAPQSLYAVLLWNLFPRYLSVFLLRYFPEVFFVELLLKFLLDFVLKFPLPGIASGVLSRFLRERFPRYIIFLLEIVPEDWRRFSQSFLDFPVVLSGFPVLRSFFFVWDFLKRCFWDLSYRFVGVLSDRNLRRMGFIVRL